MFPRFVQWQPLNVLRLQFTRLKPHQFTKTSFRPIKSSKPFSPKLHHLILPSTLLYAASHTQTLINETLKPDSSGDTFEMGLYLSSQHQLTQHINSKRQKTLEKCRFSVTRAMARYWFYLKDYVLEPMFTIFRFLELSAIFVPVFLAYPISLFGHAVCVSNLSSTTVTSGSLVWYKILRKALELAGPSFIKLGQWAGSRTDIFSEGLCKELGNLHSNAKSHSLAYTKQEIVSSLGLNSFDEVFEEFSETPLGVGAIAQVYVGKLSEQIIRGKNIKLGEDGNRWCAVKVIHPHAPRKINRDLKIMKFFASSIDMLPTMEWLSLPNEVDQFAILMQLQLDLRIECLNLSRFNKNFKDNIQVKFPQGFQELTSRSVLFEEYIHGLPMEKFLQVKTDVDSVDLCKKVSDPFIDAFLQMLILDDFIHADLHPGNVMIRFVETDDYETKIKSDEAEAFEVIQNLKKKLQTGDDSFIHDLRSVLTDYTPQICFIDTGLVTELNDRNRVNFIALFNALAQFDGYRAGELMIERSRTPETAIDKELFALKVEKLVSKVKKRTFTLGTVSIGDLLDQMLGMVRGHHVRMEGDFVSVVVAILLLEGIGRQLDPELDLFARFVSFALVNGFS